MNRTQFNIRGGRDIPGRQKGDSNGHISLPEMPGLYGPRIVEIDAGDQTLQMCWMRIHL